MIPKSKSTYVKCFIDYPKVSNYNLTVTVEQIIGNGISTSYHCTDRNCVQGWRVQDEVVNFQTNATKPQGRLFCFHSYSIQLYKEHVTCRALAD